MKQVLQHKGVGFTMVANSVLLDPKLSLRAKGLFAYLYSKPEDWDFAFDRIAKDVGEGVKAVLATIKELEGAGYLERKKKKTGRTDYYVTYEPGDKANCPPSPVGYQATVSKTEYLSIKKVSLDTKSDVPKGWVKLHDNSYAIKKYGVWHDAQGSHAKINLSYYPELVS